MSIGTAIVVLAAICKLARGSELIAAVRADVSTSGRVPWLGQGPIWRAADARSADVQAQHVHELTCARRVSTGAIERFSYRSRSSFDGGMPCTIRIFAV